MDNLEIKNIIKVKTIQKIVTYFKSYILYTRHSLIIFGKIYFKKANIPKPENMKIPDIFNKPIILRSAQVISHFFVIFEILITSLPLYNFKYKKHKDPYYPKQK